MCVCGGFWISSLLNHSIFSAPLTYSVAVVNIPAKLVFGCVLSLVENVTSSLINKSPHISLDTVDSMVGSLGEFFTHTVMVQKPCTREWWQLVSLLTGSDQPPCNQGRLRSIPLIR